MAAVLPVPDHEQAFVLVATNGSQGRIGTLSGEFRCQNETKRSGKKQNAQQETHTASVSAKLLPGCG